MVAGSAQLKWPPAQTAPMPPSFTEPSLPSVVIDKLMAEVCVTAAQCAVIASCLNGFLTGQTKTALVSLIEWVPREQVLLSFVRHNRQLDCNLVLDPDAVCAIQDLFAEIDYGRQALEQLLEDASLIGEDRSAFIHLGALKSTWQSVCRRAQNALFDLLVAAVSIRNRKTPTALSGIVQLLEDAANGLCPCLDGEGQATLRALPNFRLMPRYSIGQDCIIENPAGPVVAFAKDISMAGIGLENVPHLSVDEEVEVELASGRMFSGVVVWVAGMAAGIKFRRPLRPSDPLLSG